MARSKSSEKVSYNKVILRFKNFLAIIPVNSSHCHVAVLSRNEIIETVSKLSIKKNKGLDFLTSTSSIKR